MGERIHEIKMIVLGVLDQFCVHRVPRPCVEHHVCLMFKSESFEPADAEQQVCAGTRREEGWAEPSCLFPRESKPFVDANVAKWPDVI